MFTRKEVPVFTVKEYPEISNDRTKVHHVGLCAAVNAVMLWGAAVALVITVVAMATTEWATVKIEHVHTGLWRVCNLFGCEDILSAPHVPGKHYRSVTK